MCVHCYEDYGAPAVLTETTRHAASLISRVCQHDPVGGNLHAILDDWLIEDINFEELNTDVLVGEAQRDAEKECFETLKSMSIPERASALAMHFGFLAYTALN
jgi:hypothetical protein